MAAGKWLIAKGSGIFADPSDEEGEIIEYNPAMPKPEQARISALPNFVESLNQDLITDFTDVGGQRTTSFAPGPSLTAGVAMQVQAELTDEILSPLIKRIGRSMEVVANQQLVLITQNWTDPRKIQVIGESGGYIIETIKSVDFRDHTDVHIEIESLFPQFRGQKEQQLYQLWDRRIIQDPQTFIRLLRFGDFDSLIEKAEAVEESIESDIKMIKGGKQPEVHENQNHMEYVKRLGEWFSTPDWLRLPADRKQLSIDFMKMHAKFLMATLPNQGEPVEEQNPAAIGSPMGPIKPTWFIS